MLIGKATGVCVRNLGWKAGILSPRIIRSERFTDTTPLPLFTLQQRYKTTSSNENDSCKDEPQKSRKIRKLAAIALFGTTVAIVTAKHDNDFRDWSKEHIPALDNMVKIIFQEEQTYLESLDKAHKAVSARIKNALYYLFKENSGSKHDNSNFRTLGDQSGKLPALEPCDAKPYKPPESAFLPKIENEKTDITKSAQVPKELQEMQLLEDKLSKTAQDTIQSLETTVCALRDYSKMVEYLDQIISSSSTTTWDKIRRLQSDAVKGMEKSRSQLLNFKALEKQLTARLKDDTYISDDIKAKAQNNVNTVSKDVKDAIAKLEKTKENTVLARRSWDKVKRARLHFSEELEILFPNIWLNDEKLNVPADQFDSFIEYVISMMAFWGKQSLICTNEEPESKENFNSLIEDYKNNNPEAIQKIADDLATHMLRFEKAKYGAELQKNVLAHQAKCDHAAKTLMKQTKEVYADLTAEALSIKEKEVERKIQQQLEERLAQARAEHKMEVAKMVGRMQGANEAIAKRGEKDKSQQDKQQFWSAAQRLMSAVKPIGAAAQGQEPKPLKNEITNLNKAKLDGDELVESVLSSIPPDAIERGVPSEALLRERFFKVTKSARAWAGVPPGEVTLIQVLLARFQSALYLNIDIPQAELDNEPAIDPQELNNYDILSRAKYYVDRGEFDQAIRYLNLLQGPAGLVASDWVRDALMYLETRQAAELLLAHATTQL
ncbi:MICOS complex subunit Mic60-like isoform X2 [Macrosteles quadrilineatus]|uniref:MICOS complex subunit Mic60-like isoform X2 n=1 Tax=Macrosteles quadrilineatus TaxID=74068 RepID=UPI0023E21E25|nr:MICOS complex subunit Mic60-like isoform X2 [Macrosteles quadrilineatus]